MGFVLRFQNGLRASVLVMDSSLLASSGCFRGRRYDGGPGERFGETTQFAPSGGMGSFTQRVGRRVGEIVLVSVVRRCCTRGDIELTEEIADVPIYCSMA